MSDYNERACTNCGSLLHHEDNCDKNQQPAPVQGYSREQVEDLLNTLLTNLGYGFVGREKIIENTMATHSLPVTDTKPKQDYYECPQCGDTHNMGDCNGFCSAACLQESESDTTLPATEALSPKKIDEEGNRRFNSGEFELSSECVAFKKGAMWASTLPATGEQDGWVRVEDRLPDEYKFGGYLVKFVINTGETMQCVATFQNVPQHNFENPPMHKKWYVYPSSGHEIFPIAWKNLPE